MSPVGSGMWFSAAASSLCTDKDSVYPPLDTCKAGGMKTPGQVCLEILEGGLEVLGCRI